MRLNRSKILRSRALIFFMCGLVLLTSNSMYLLPRAEALPGEKANVFLLPGVTAEASGSNPTEPPEQAIDGNAGSKWSHNTGTAPLSPEHPYWLTVDLGTEATVSRFELKHAEAGGEDARYNTRDYKIETSDDNIHWKEAVSVTGNVYSETIHDLPSSVTARYFKLSITNPGDAEPTADTYAATIYEFAAYGVASDAQMKVLSSAPSTTIIDKNSSWKYLDDGSDQGSAWQQPAYDDSAWKNGEAPLGYASSGKGLDLKTWIGYGPNASNKYITAYFRKEFTADTTDLDKLMAKLVRDDGAVIYLNGTEIYRTNMPAGPITSSTLASSAVGDERDTYAFEIDKTLLVNGTNVIAAEVHQNIGTSSDTFFSLELEGTAAVPLTDHGLLAQYYTSKGTAGDYAPDVLKSTTIDPQLNFSDLEPIHTARTGQADNVFVRWNGQLTVPVTNDYTFYLKGDNGFRLWIEDMSTPIIDFWKNQWDVEQTSAPVHLEAGKKYKIKVEYFENNGGSNLYFWWSSAGLPKEIVPEKAFSLPAGYSGPASGTLAPSGKQGELHFLEKLGSVPSNLAGHLSVTVGDEARPVTAVSINPQNVSALQLQLDKPVLPGEIVNVAYDGSGNLLTEAGAPVGSFIFSLNNLSQFLDYSPIAIAMSFYGSPKTNRSFAWYTKYDLPQNAPANAKDSIVEVVKADGQFGTDKVIRVQGDPDQTKVLNLKITNSTNGSFISHKVLVEGLTPGTAYKYRVGSDGNWSAVGKFTTEAEDEKNYEFLYMTDSQGANSHDYEVWADTLRKGLKDFPDSKFMIMSGDQVDAGALEYQWLDYFAKPQDMLMNLPLMAAVGNHEGPYNDNYYYHFNYPNDSIDNPLPPGSVYSYDYGDAHFMILNTMDMGWDDRQKESFRQQIEWLRREVAQTDKKWKVVAFHKAIYSVGGHAVDGDILELRKMLYPVFDELGIDVVLQGHDHTFMRSHQMYGDKAITDLERDGSGNPLNPDGTMYIVNNSAGTKYYDVKNEVNKYYAAAFEQPRVPVYSGIRMTEDSFSIDSYRSGEAQPFDTYTIVRNDGKPVPVKALAATRNNDGKVVLSWTRPEDKNAKDAVRGFRIYEQDGKLGMNWSAYVQAEAGKDSYEYLVKEADAKKDYVFVVQAVDKRDNSLASTVSTGDGRPAAPTAPAVDDGFNTFGWSNVPGYAQAAEYEYSLDGGKSWKSATANPQPLGDGNYPAGTVLIRVKANEATGVEAGAALASDKDFTVNGLSKTYALTGTLAREGQLRVDVNVERMTDYSQEAYVVFELMDGDTPLLINAIPVKKNKLSMSQYFDVSGAKYKVKVFVIDTFDSELEAPVHLAKPIELQ